MGIYKHKSFLVLLLLVLAFAPGGCRKPSGETKANSGIRIVKDDLGNDVKLPAKVTRAISLAPNLTEIVFAVGAGDRLVGVTTFCNYPKEAASVQKVGDTLKPNIESIIALQPQVVLVSTASQLESFSKVLNEQGIEVFVTNPTTLEGVYAGISRIAEIFGETAKAQSMVVGMRKRAGAASEKVGADGTRKTVFVQIDKSLYTVGKGSFISDALSGLKIDSVTNDIDEPYPKISKEHARKLNPDFIILAKSEGNTSLNEVFQFSAAVKEGRVFEIDADILSRPGPRIIDALEQIAKFADERSGNK